MGSPTSYPKTNLFGIGPICDFYFLHGKICDYTFFFWGFFLFLF